MAGSRTRRTSGGSSPDCSSGSPPISGGIGDGGEAMSDRAFRRLALAVALVAALARGAAAWPRIGGVADDPDNYLPLAESIQRGLGFRVAAGHPLTAYR